MTVRHQGKVFLVGSGPGDPGLLTVRARECIHQADVIVYDRLISDRIIDLLPQSAEKVALAELPGSHAEYWKRIPDLLIEAARRQKLVVRLKSGDPCIFGRGGEEAQALAAAGVPFEIVPGVTAALGSCAYAGIPLTHRDHAAGVVFVTGHECVGRTSPAVDWAWLAKFSGTIVIYMGMSRLETIVEALLREGMSPTTRAAIIQHGGTAHQRSIKASLHDLCTRARDAGLHAPAVIVLGEVVGLSESLDWFARLPLAGRRILVPRAMEQGREFARELEQLGAAAYLLPTIAIMPLDDWHGVDNVLSRLSEFAWLVFTSVHGVDALLGRLWHTGRDLRALSHLKIAAIGPGTAHALEKFHLRADLVPPEYRSESLAEALMPHVHGKGVLLARADRGREVLRELLAPIARVEQIAVYRQVDQAIDPRSHAMKAMHKGEIDWVVLTSSNMARSFLRQLDGTAAKWIHDGRTKLLSISPVTSQAIRAEGFPVSREATVYTMSGIVQALLDDVTS